MRFRGSSGWAATLVFALYCPLLAGQILPTTVGKNVPAPAAVTPDPLRRESPRTAIYAFLQACHENKLDLAAQYLDLRKIRLEQRARQGPTLAKDLCDALDRDSQFEVGRLSNQDIGNLGDSLPPDTDRLQTFEIDGQSVVFTMQRQSMEGRQLWLVSADSVAYIVRLSAMAGESQLEKKLPSVLVETRFIATPLYKWIALFLAALILGAVSRLLARLVIAAARAIARRTKRTVQEHRMESFAEPLRILLTSTVFVAVMEAIAPSALLRDYILKVIALLFFAGVASLVMRVVDAVADTMRSRMSSNERALSFAVFPLVVRSIKVVIIAVAILSILSAWGYNTNAILAGLGVGGLAVALAAQKTIENLFGGVSIIWDRPVVVGDFCRFGDQVGTIEDIGLRSTRIRTLDRTVVTIPNSVFSMMTLENFAKRDRMWFHPTISLHRDTRSADIQAMMDAITAILKNHVMVDPTAVPLRLTKITKESYDLDVFAYVLTASFDEFLKVQSELIFAIIDAASKLGVDFACPMQETLVAGLHGMTASTQTGPSDPKPIA